jgi:hypothetical protein
VCRPRPAATGLFFRVTSLAVVINAASDGLSGAEGEHCVDTRAKVGDSITLPNGSVWKVASLSGTSTRCQNPAHPIRAKLTPI